MFRTLVSAAALGLAAMAAAAAGPAQASPVTILPAFVGSTECVSGAIVDDESGPCAVGGASASFTASPFAGVQAQSMGGPTISNGALAFLRYFYTIDGPDTSPVQVDIFTNVFASVTGGPNNVGFASLVDTEGHQICVIVGQSGCPDAHGAASLNGAELTEMETPGLTYSLLLEVEASTAGGAGNTAFATADPLILVDANNVNAGAYSIRVSDGIANALPASGTPEPAEWVMLLAGFAGLGAAMRRRMAAAV